MFTLYSQFLCMWYKNADNPTLLKLINNLRHVITVNCITFVSKNTVFSTENNK